MVETVFGTWFLVIVAFASGTGRGGVAIAKIRMENENNCRIQQNVIKEAFGNPSYVFCVRGILSK